MSYNGGGYNNGGGYGGGRGKGGKGRGKGGRGTFGKGKGRGKGGGGRGGNRQSCKELMTLEGHSAPVLQMAVQHEQQQLFTGSDDGTFKVWSLQQNCQQVHSQQKVGGVTCLQSISSFLFCGDQQTFEVYNLSMGQQSMPLVGHTAVVKCVASATVANETLVFSAGDDMTINVYRWDGNLFAPFRQMQGHQGIINTMVVHPGQEWLFSAGQDGIKVWSLNDLQNPQLPVVSPATALVGHEGNVNCLTMPTIQSNAFLLSSGDDGCLKVWDGNTGQEEHSEHMGPSFCTTMATIENKAGDPILVTGHVDGSIKMWGLPTFDKAGVLKSHQDTVRCVLQGPGSTFFSCSNDTTIKVWEMQQ